MSELASQILAGDVRATGRACRLVDDRAEGHRELLRELAAAGRRAWWIGVTGNPGAGKSTLTDRLIERFRKDGLVVGVVAVDPTSPFSGGAILGDRIRMQRHFEDAGVFIRSVATRGALGGISRTTADIASVLEAWGAERVVLETVGVGQDEVDVARTAHTTLVVVMPGLGDEVQALKAGIAECADVFAVNKADLPGADAAVRDLTMLLALETDTTAPQRTHSAPAVVRADSSGSERWIPPIIPVIATRGDGIDELVDALGRHRSWLESTQRGRAESLERTRARLVARVREAVADAAVERLGDVLADAAERVERGELDLETALDRLLGRSS